MLKKVKFFICGIAIVATSLLSFSAYATSVKAIALFQDRAMLSVDGGKAKIVRAGTTHSGVKLIKSNTSEAVIEVNGKRETLNLNSSLVLEESLGAQAAESYASSVQLFIDEQGFYRATGKVDGKGIEFLVDTGANLVVLNSIQAKQVGLDYKQGIQTSAQTASGVTPMYIVNVNRISIGGIELNNIEAGVIEGSFPAYPLLGMTFLSRLNMQQSEGVMTLSRR